VCCSVLQCVAVCCSVLQCVAVCWRVVQCVGMCCSVLQCVAVCCSVLQCFMHDTSSLIKEDLYQNLHSTADAMRCSVLQCVAVCCSAWCTKPLASSKRPFESSSYNWRNLLQCVAMCCSVLFTNLVASSKKTLSESPRYNRRANDNRCGIYFWSTYVCIFSVHVNLSIYSIYMFSIYFGLTYLHIFSMGWLQLVGSFKL